MTHTPEMTQMDRAIGETVRKHREARKLNVIEAAKMIGLSVAAYEASELGYQPFQAVHVFKLSEFFGCQPRDLMPTNDRLKQMDGDVRYGEPEEVSDLIYYFSGVVSPTLRGFILNQIKKASVQGERSEDISRRQAAPQKKKRLLPFRLLSAN